MEQQLRLYAEDLVYLAPELTLVIAAIILSILDLFLNKSVSRHLMGWLALAAIAVSAAFTIYHLNPAEPISLLNDSYRVDDFAGLFKLIFLAGAGFIILMSLGSVKKDDIPHLGEFYYLFLPATLGGMIMASSGDLITLFVGLELLSITSYILVGMRKKHLASNESAFKYLVTGAISSAFILYGMSFLYGMTGSTNIGEINMLLGAQSHQFTALIYVSFFLMLTGFAFKIAAAPFHTWAPEVYAGAPTPVAAFLAVVSKAAAFAIFIRVVYNVYFGLGEGPFDTLIHEDIFLTLSVLAAIAMIVGNVAALRQTSVKRLLAFSGVANAGYLLVPMATPFGMVHFSNFTEFTFYLIAYLLMNVGMFAVLMVLTSSSDKDGLDSFAGLYYRSPVLALATTVLVLSLAGLPLTGGFVGKLLILLGTIQGQNYWLAAVMIGTSVISFYYYFNIIRQMYMRGNETAAVRIGAPIGTAIGICAIATLLMGFLPHVVMAYIDSIFSISLDFFVN